MLKKSSNILKTTIEIVNLNIRGNVIIIQYFQSEL